MNNENIIQLSPDKIKFSSVEQAIDDIRNGKFVIVADDEGRENEGDLICAAEKITPEMMNFMLAQARGMVCVALTGERAGDLKLYPMVEDNTDPHRTAYTVSVDAGFEFGVTTGVSASDRATTIQRLATQNATALDFRRPGHTFPVVARHGGVFRRIGHTEAAIDLTRLAGLSPMGVMCEILNEDGSMARRDDLAGFAKKHGLSFVTIAQLIQYRLQHERSVTRRVTREIDTPFGIFTAIGYKDALDGCEHLALVKGSIEALATNVPYVRVQHEDVITDLLGRADEEMPHEIMQSMRIIQENESGVLVYLRHQDDAVHGVVGALRNYDKPDVIAPNANGSKSDMREYGAGAQILADLGITRFNMISQNKKKIVALRGYGLEVAETIPLAGGDFDYSLPPKVELPSSFPTLVEEEAQITQPIVAPDPVAPEPVAPEPVAVEKPATETGPAEQEKLTWAVSEPVAEIPSFIAASQAVSEEVTEILAEVLPPTSTEPTPELPLKLSIEPVDEPLVEILPEERPAEAPSVVSSVVELKPAKPEAEATAASRFPTMRMGAKVMSGQALFEG